MLKTIDPIIANAPEAREFAKRYLAAAGDLSSLSSIRTPIIRKILKEDADGLFLQTLREIRKNLTNPEIGLSVIDLPSNLSSNKGEDTLYACLAASGIMSLLSDLVEDTKSLTPFTLYNASKENEAKLVEAGLKFYSPEDRLGFHTDGLIQNSNVIVPYYIGIYNIMVAYRKPGNFYYLPVTLWHDHKRFQSDFGTNRDVTFSMTPIVYAGEDGAISSSESRAITAPVFWSDGDAQAIFYNGEVDTGPDKTIKLAKAMTDSLLDNPERVAAPIKNRRLFIMANDKGFHARDIFADPIDGVRYTRSFMRFVSQTGHCVKHLNDQVQEAV